MRTLFFHNMLLIILSGISVINVNNIRHIYIWDLWM